MRCGRCARLQGGLLPNEGLASRHTRGLLQDSDENNQPLQEEARCQCVREAADPNVVRDKFGHTALHFAAKNGNSGLVRALRGLASNFSLRPYVMFHRGGSRWTPVRPDIAFVWATPMSSEAPLSEHIMAWP